MVEHPMADLEWDPDTYLAMNGDELADGDFVARTADGRVTSIAGFKNGARHGQSRSYYPDGSLKQEGTYRNGRSVGTLRKWYQNGQLREEFVSTEEGTLLRHREWREDGTLTYDSNPDADE